MAKPILGVLLVALLVMGSFAAEQARYAGRRLPRYPAQEEYDEEEGEDQEMEEEPALIQSASATQTSAGADADLMQSLFSLLKQGSAQDQKLAAELSQESAQSAALQSDLQQKQAQLARHQQMLKRLETCLNTKEQTPAPVSMMEEAAKATAEAAQPTCDCEKLRRALADTRMELNGLNNDQSAYKAQFKKAKKELKQAIAKLKVAEAKEKQPTIKSGCDALADCRSCIANPSCGWCSSSNGAAGVPEGQGMCRRHDVTARLRGFPNQDGLTSGECSTKNWQTTVSQRVTALSWDIFASDINHAVSRAHVIFDVIKRSDPTFIAFQGVEDWFLQALKLESWVSAYKQTDFGSGHAAGGLHILSKYPISKFQYFESTSVGQVHYDTRPRLLVAEVDVPAGAGGAANSITLATTAFDYRSAPNRVDSLKFVNNVLSGYDDVVLMGNFNFDQGAQPESDHISKAFLDVWPALETGSRGYTWSPEFNLYAKMADPTAGPSRIDRIFIKSGHWLPRRIRRLGCSSIDLLCQSTFNRNKVIPPQPSVYDPAAAPAPKPQTPATKATSFLEMSADSKEDVVIPSTHFALFLHLSHFQPKC